MTAGTGITVGILAGGRGTRMGRDKATLPFGGRSLLAHVLDNVRDAASEILVSCRADAPPEVHDARVVLDTEAGRGPVEGVLRILEESASPFVCVLPVDMPWVTGPHLRRLVDALHGVDALALSSDGVPEPFPLVARRGVRAAVRAAVREGDLKVTSFLGRVTTRRVELADLFGRDEAVLLTRNLNTPEDARSAILRLGFDSGTPRIEEGA